MQQNQPRPAASRFPALPPSRTRRRNAARGAPTADDARTNRALAEDSTAPSKALSRISRATKIGSRTRASRKGIKARVAAAMIAGHAMIAANAKVGDAASNLVVADVAVAAGLTASASVR